MTLCREGNITIHFPVAPTTRGFAFSEAVVI